MEILIVGIILVLLMAYVSTKIKKSSAAAYQPELLEAVDYSIIKPEGYIVPWNQESAFKALSKEMGTEEGAENLYHSRADLRVFSEVSFEEICRGARKSVKKIISEETAKDGDLKYCFIHAKNFENETGIEVYYKIVENQPTSKVYEFQVSVLNEAMETYSAKASEMLQSFTVKLQK